MTDQVLLLVYIAPLIDSIKMSILVLISWKQDMIKWISIMKSDNDEISIGNTLHCV